MTPNWNKKGNDLLHEISCTQIPGSCIAIWYLGQMGILAKTPDLTICFDPVLNDLFDPQGNSRRCYHQPFSAESLTGIHYVVCSHNHADHLNLETLLPLYQANPTARFIVPAPEVSSLTGCGIPDSSVIGAIQNSIIPLSDGSCIYPIAAAHEVYTADEQGRQKNLGYIWETPDIHVYHAGDTVVTNQLIADVCSHAPIHLACIPINGIDTQRRNQGIIGNMDCRDAAYFSSQIQADLTIPLHYDMVMNNTENPLIFASYMQSMYSGSKYHIMQLGERLLYMP